MAMVNLHDCVLAPRE